MLTKISLKLHKRRGSYWREKKPINDFQKKLQKPKNMSAKEIGDDHFVAMTTLMSL